ncbi:MAG: hypothetical protein QNJ72_42965 [Pleurocapsa sp. MO_226.B13]|nr:hypothetical protein [Pleurocapsa sp. MO_226.B13]
MNQFIKNNLPKNVALPNLADNLGIEKLQAKIATLYGLEKQEDIKLLTALLVEYLADNLELIQKPAEILNGNVVDLTCFPSLPIDFPQNAEIPMYLYGDKVCHESIEDYGVVIGRFYAFDPNSKHWQWKYLILEKVDSITVSLFSTCTYWETELKPSN